MSLQRKMKRDARRREYAAGQLVINRTPLTPSELAYATDIGLPVAAHRMRRMDHVTVDRGYTGPNKPDKGLEDGSCNRTACQAPGATWFNHSTRAWYCRPCAHLINAACRQDQFIRYLGHDLCTPKLPVGEIHDEYANSPADAA